MGPIENILDFVVKTPSGNIWKKTKMYVCWMNGKYPVFCILTNHEEKGLPDEDNGFHKMKLLFILPHLSSEFRVSIMIISTN